MIVFLYQSGVPRHHNFLIFFIRFLFCILIFEPGRSIIANTGILISKVIYIKENPKKVFIILDAAMNDLMRPALYGAKHQIIPLIKEKKISNKSYMCWKYICWRNWKNPNIIKDL